MGRRKEFKSIVEDVTQFFISRNNDIEGYWGIGKLYSYMVASGIMKLKIDLVERRIEPNTKCFNNMVDNISDLLLFKMKRLDLSQDKIQEAQIIITGFPNDKNVIYGKMAPNRMNCKLVIVNDLNKQYICEKDTWCREHDPNKEQRRELKN